MANTPARHWDIFCKVVDNYGDIGVTWRLARQLAHEHGQAIRLWIDDLGSAARLIEGLDPARPCQPVQGITICTWQTEWTDTVVPGDVVIEAFACELPYPWLAAMSRSSPPPCWINLEYLSAEDWVGGCHGMRSVHPRLGLVKTFYFPGFTPQTGGLLREQGLDARREAWLAGIQADEALAISLFCYPNAALPGLLDTWRAGTRAIHCRVPQGRALENLAPWLGEPAEVGRHYVRGALTVEILPFSDQDGYDRLLWQSDLNFVRGEDSFVRAQWAERPFLWHIYPQDDDAHIVKLDAFLACYCHGLDPVTAEVLVATHHAWNRGQDMTSVWKAMEPHIPALLDHARHWARRLQENGDLASRLVQYVQNQIQ